VFFTYLRRELRRRMRQAILIAFGLAVGIGLVITVTALSTGVRNAQSTVLHSLYGVGTDVTVTKAPAAQAGGPRSFGFRGATGTSTRPAAGTKIDIDTLGNFGLGTLSSSSVTAISGLRNVAAAAGGLTLTDTKITGTIPAINSSGGGGGFGGGGSGGGGSGGGFRGAFTPTTFSVSGVDLSQGELGPLSSGKLASGRTFTSADASSNVAVVDSDYANLEQAQGRLGDHDRQDQLQGHRDRQRAGRRHSASDAYIPLARAQTLASMKNDVNDGLRGGNERHRTSPPCQRIISALMPGHRDQLQRPGQ
jgi:ABC-type antimicrobial peptide transport system permease subunit